MNLKRILYIAPALPVGGAEKFLVSLTGALQKDTGKQLLVSLSDDNPLLKEFDPSIEFHNFVRQGKFDTRPLFALRKLVKKEQPDIIFCLNFFAWFFARLALWGSGTKAQFIISYHSTIQLVKREHKLHKLYAWMLRKRDTIITVSENQAAYTAATYKIPTERFHTIHNGIDTDRWRPAPESWDRSGFLGHYGIPVGAPVILMSAALRTEKNHTGAVRALALLHAQYNRPVWLLLVGDGIMREEIRHTAVAEKMEPFVVFAGNQTDVLPFYQSSDLFTLVSHSETFSMAALEALSCGLPGVMTNVGGAPEMITEGFNGYLCRDEPADIARAWKECLTTEFSTVAIRHRVEENFSKDRMFTEYRRFLQLNPATNLHN